MMVRRIERIERIVEDVGSTICIKDLAQYAISAYYRLWITGCGNFVLFILILLLQYREEPHSREGRTRRH